LIIFAFALLSGLSVVVEAQTSAVTPALKIACCEKTTWGAWCQNAKPENCDLTNGLRTTPTSCDATSFCRQGCCYDSNEGICSENTPQKVCEQNKGTWADSASCEIPQCNLGCCLLDNQAAFVTLVRCKKLSAQYGLQTNFRTDIKSETACIGTAQSQDRGACVFEEQFTKTCKFMTKGECDAMKSKKTGNVTSGNITFHKDFLCTAEELGTNCNMQDKTMCAEGKDEVYFVDTCGNPGNIYDASKRNEKAYWRKIIAKKDSCGSNSANANSASCGNCDYFAGSFCKNYDKNKDKSRPTYGDYICRDLNCKKTADGKDYKHGESWCIYDAATGDGKDLAGSRQFKHICIAGEELVEPCDDFRQKVCLQDKITTDKGDFQQAGCVANRWQDCASQKEKKDCENMDKRDCQWIEDVIGQDNFGSLGNATAVISTSKDKESKVKEMKKHGVCVPDVPPGLKFYNSGEAEGICSQGNSVCTVEFEKGLFGSASAKTNSECLSSIWTKKRQEVCQAFGDCSGSVKTCENGKCEIKKGVWSVLSSGFGISGTGAKK
jgi:hypothetical protein